MRTCSVLILACLACLLCALPALGLEPYLVKDINPVSEPADSRPADFGSLGSVALFDADDGLTGVELWRSDGTAAGTWQVADLCRPDCSGRPTRFAATSRHYFFRALDENHHPNLWVTSGGSGALQLTDPSVTIGFLWAAAGDVLYFTAEDQAHGLELWRSNGTVAGTWLVTDLRPGPQGSDLRSMAAFKGSVYFSADDGRAGLALWKTDGTAAGTVMVKDPVPSSPAGPGPTLLQVVGSRLVFLATTPGRGTEIWASDGTARGTQAITDIVPGPGSPAIWDLSVQGGRLYLVIGDGRKGQELWVTDGTAKNTRVLTNLSRKDAFFSDSQAYSLYLPRAAAGGRFVFLAHDGAHGIEPWVTDGSAKGTRLLKDLCPGTCSGANTLWDRPLAGRLFLTGTNGVRGQEVWVTDGTAAGTRLLRDICRGPCDALPFAPFVVGNRLVFAANDGIHGYEIWSTDGTAAGTVRISDFVPELPWDVFGGSVAGGQLLFGAPGPEGRELWRTDGTAAGTRLVRDINESDLGGSDPHALMPLGSEVFFFAHDESGSQGLWKSDGTEAGTVWVAPVVPVDQALSTEAGGKLFFMGTQQFLWRTDGTEAGTFSLGVQISGLRAVGATVFFPVRGLEGPAVLWATDGTVAGTRQVRPGDSGPFDPTYLTAFQGKLYFAARDPDHGVELWRSDGTEAGTVLVKDIYPGSFSSSGPSALTVHAGRLWFFADDEHGRGLWSSDGTAAGTVLEVETEIGFTPFQGFGLVSVGSQLLINGLSRRYGFGIWRTADTPEGTQVVSYQVMLASALFQGGLYFGSSDPDHHEYLWVTSGYGAQQVFDRNSQPIPSPRRFAALDGHLVFNTGEGGVPLWVTDGTQEGTFPLLPETLPGSDGAAWDLVRAGSRVFFPAYSRENGVELWAVDEDTP
ncbi:MAG: ELWxxDGT repeat protein [Acidobacteriota bacterium]